MVTCAEPCGCPNVHMDWRGRALIAHDRWCGIPARRFLGCPFQGEVGLSTSLPRALPSSTMVQPVGLPTTLHSFPAASALIGAFLVLASVSLSSSSSAVSIALAPG